MMSVTQEFHNQSRSHREDLALGSSHVVIKLEQGSISSNAGGTPGPAATRKEGGLDLAGYVIINVLGSGSGSKFPGSVGTVASEGTYNQERGIGLFGLRY